MSTNSLNWKKLDFVENGENYSINKDTCEIRNDISLKLLTPQINSSGYLCVNLNSAGKKPKRYDGDVCVEAERVFTFPNQMSALRHYRRAVEQAALYDDIKLFNNEVKYDLKEEQHKLETKGLTKEQLKAKFDKQISDAKNDLHHQKEKMKADLRQDGKYIEKDMKCCDKKDCKDKK